jgi:general stress protein YciG
MPRKNSPGGKQYPKELDEKKRNDRTMEDPALGRDARDDDRPDPDDGDERPSGGSRTTRKGQDNPGNFANDPDRASEAGRKGGRR